MLTEEKVAKAFGAAGERMSGIEEDLQTHQKGLDRLCDQVKKMFSGYGKAIGSGTLDDQDYQSFWPNEAMAKDFGICVMRAIGSQKYKDMGTTVDTAGGALVPTELAN